MSRAAAIATIVCGLAIVVVAQRVAPIRGLPLYDGVVVEEPYRWVNPGPNQEGDPGVADASLPLSPRGSPAFAAATPEDPPQAQFIADSGALVPPSGATTLHATITPLAATAEQQTAAPIGNVYRIDVVDEAGNSWTFASGRTATIVMRAPGPADGLTLARWDGAAWRGVSSVHAGEVDLLQAEINQLGDYTFVEESTFSIAPVAAVALAILIGFGALVAVLYGRNRGTRPARRVTATRPTDPDRPRRVSSSKSRRRRR